MKIRKTKNRKTKVFSGVLLLLCVALAVFSTVCIAKNYTGDSVLPGLSGILPEDSLTFPENTVWGTLTANWGVKVRFVDWDETELKSETVPVTDTTPGSSSAPEKPTRSRYVFTGWERHDTNGGTASLHDDGRVTGIDGPGPIVYIATYEQVAFSVKYVVKSAEKWGMPDDSVIPDDGTLYNLNDNVRVARMLTSKQKYAIDSESGERVSGTWSFVAWNKDDFNITEDTTITGEWVFTPGVEPSDPESPITGDKIVLWLSIFVSSVFVIVCCVLWQKRNAIKH